MNRSQLVDKIAEKAELTKKDADKFLSAYIEAVTEALQADDKVALVGFGTFEVRDVLHVKDVTYTLEKQLKLKQANTLLSKLVKL